MKTPETNLGEPSKNGNPSPEEVQFIAPQDLPQPNEYILREHPFLRGLDREAIQLLASLATIKHFSADDLIFREGAKADRLYLIQKGEVELQSHSAGYPVTVQTLGPGDALGWSWLFPPYLWHFDAWVPVDTETIAFSGPELRQLCHDHPALGYEIMRRVSETVIHRLQATRLKLVNACRKEKRGGPRS